MHLVATMNDDKLFILPLLIVLLLLVPVTMVNKLGLSPDTIIKTEQLYSANAKERLMNWQELIRDYQGQSEWQIINAVNDFFNILEFIPDEKHWGSTDYWATPLEFLTTNGGDCEDFSIAKYFTLLELGIPDERLRITYVKAVHLNQAHMVLAYYKTLTSEPLILDNIRTQIKSASQRSDLLPIYSFNGSNLWLANASGQGRQIQGGSQRINLWRDLNARLQTETYLGRNITAQTMQNRN